MPTPTGFLTAVDPKQQSKLTIKPLRRGGNFALDDDDDALVVKRKLFNLTHDSIAGCGAMQTSINQLHHLAATDSPVRNAVEPDASREIINKLREEIENLKQVNQSLYNFAVDELCSRDARSERGDSQSQLRAT